MALGLLPGNGGGRVVGLTCKQIEVGGKEACWPRWAREKKEIAWAKEQGYFLND